MHHCMVDGKYSVLELRIVLKLLNDKPHVTTLFSVDMTSM